MQSGPYFVIASLKASVNNVFIIMRYDAGNGMQTSVSGVKLGPLLVKMVQFLLPTYMYVSCFMMSEAINYVIGHMNSAAHLGYCNKTCYRSLYDSSMPMLVLAQLCHLHLHIIYLQLQHRLA